MNDEIYLNEIEFRCYYYNNMPTNYYINKYGDVYSIKTNKLLNPSIDCSGRKIVCLYINGKSVVKTIHSMVAKVYLGDKPKDGDITINHINEKFLDNNVDNLEYLTRRDNVISYLKNNNYKFEIKYSDDLIHKICSDLKSGIYYRDLVEKYDVPIMYLYNIVHNKCRSNIVTLYTPFPESAYRNRRSLKLLIPKLDELIIKGLSNKEIMNKLNLDYVNANIKIIIRRRKILGIKDPKYFDKSFIEDIDKLIIEGLSNNQIIKTLSIKYSERISCLLCRERKKLNIPDFNENGLPKSIRDEIYKLILEGKSNKFIEERFNLSRNKYTINLFGKLRQKAKKASSTTILNGVGLK